MSSLESIVIDWMTRQGPPEWHGVGAGWNWDNGIEPLLWILDQPGCDKGTALTIFWACDPYHQVDERNPQCSPGRDDHRVVQKVLERWPHYTTTRFKFQLPQHARQLHLPTYKLTNESLERVKPMMIDVEGQERYPTYGEGIPAECRIAYLESQGEPVSDFDRQILQEEQAGENMSETDAELSARHEREIDESLTEWQEILDEVKRIRREGR